MNYVALCVFGGLVLLVFAFVASAIRVVPEYSRLVVFRLGRCVGTKGPGIVLLIPVILRYWKPQWFRKIGVE